MTYRSSFQGLFQPRSVAVIGATDREGSVGRTVLANLSFGSYRGKVYAVNPGRTEVLGLPCWKGVGEVPDHVDLAAVVTPAATVPAVIGECVQAGVCAVVVISAGFRERGATGAELEAKFKNSFGAARRVCSVRIAWAL